MLLMRMLRRCCLDAIERATVEFFGDGGAVVRIWLASASNSAIRNPDCCRPRLFAISEYTLMLTYPTIHVGTCCKDSLELPRHFTSSSLYTQICFETGHAVTRRYACTDSLGRLKCGCAGLANHGPQLQSVLIAVVRLIFTSCKFEHVMPLVRELR